LRIMSTDFSKNREKMMDSLGGKHGQSALLRKIIDTYWKV